MTGRLLLLAAFAALVAVIIDWRMLDRAPERPLAGAQRPGYYLAGVTLREFGTDGRQRLALQASRAAENPYTGVIVLDEVRVDYRAEAERAWQLTARNARVPEGSDVVQLDGDVRMRDAAPRGPAAELRTGQLFLDTARERASSDDVVTLAFGRHEMTARGLSADLKAGSLRLESQVHGRFSP